MFNETPLYLAVQYGHLSVVEYLVNHNADINIVNSRNQTPLYYASLNNYPNQQQSAIIQFLKSRGAK